MTGPGPRTGLQLAVQQRLQLQPRMLQAIEVLQLPAQELEVWLAEKLESNEALTLEERTAGPGGAADRAATDAHDEMLRNHPDRPQGLAQELEEQLVTATFEPECIEWMRFLIGCLDPAGYLSADDASLLALAEEQELAGGAASLGAGIAALQSLEPRGIGARDAIEALLLQLDPTDVDYPLLCRLLEEFIDDLAANKLPKVARALDLELPQLAELLETLRALHPRPAAELGRELAPVVRPEVVVERDEEGVWQVRVERGQLPPVALEPSVVALAKDAAQPREVRGHLRRRVEEARWIVEAVAQRGVTLLRVARALFDHQRPFLERGPAAIGPLKMGDLAAELELATSTISRAVAGKYVQTPWGILPLRHFFQSEAGGAAASSVQEVLRGLVQGEDPACPLSDDELVGQLAERGIQVARRTVAKYRKELEIPSSYRRRRHAA